MVERANWNFGPDGNPVTPEAPSPTQVTDMIVAGQPPTPEIARSLGVEHTPATSTAPVPVPAKGKGFSGLPDWDDKPRDAATGQFVSKTSDAGLVASLGLAPEVAAVLSAQPDGMASAVDSLRDGMSRIYGDDAAQVAEWAAELSPALQAKCARVLLQNPHVRKAELAKRIRWTLTLDEAAEIEAWLNKD